MTTAIPTNIGGSAGLPTAPTVLNFQQAWQLACKRARVSITKTEVTDLAQDYMNTLYEDLCNLCGSAPWRRKIVRLTTLPRLSGSTATWTNGTASVTLAAAEALTAGQQTAYVGARIRNPVTQEYHWINAIPGAQTITLDTAYQGETTTADGGWEIFQDIYGLPGDHGEMVAIESPIGRPALRFAGEAELRELHYMGVSIGTPREWSYVYAGDSRRQILLFPAPDEALVYTLTYENLITRLTGTQAFVLPAEGIAVLIYLTTAELAATIREGAGMAEFWLALGQKRWDRFIGKYAPEAPKLRMQLSGRHRPWARKTVRFGGTHVDGEAWLRE